MGGNELTPSPSLDADLARLLLRVSVGGTMIAHGVKHARSLPGTARWFESIGFRKPRLQAQLSAAVEIGSGAALIVGAIGPSYEQLYLHIGSSIAAVDHGADCMIENDVARLLLVRPISEQ